MTPEITTEQLEIAVPGGRMSAHLARPVDAGSYPGVIVGQEIWGLSEQVLAAAERIARMGAVALVPDLYHRVAPRVQLTEPGDRERGMDLFRTLRRDEVRNDIAAGIDRLAELGTTSAHMVGFSAGAHVAFYAATQLPLATTAAFYPGWLMNTEVPLSTPEPTGTLAAGITGRIALFFGGRDHIITAMDRFDLAKVLLDNGIDYTMTVYEEAPHGFVFPGRDWYHRPSAEDAWARLEAMLTGPSDD
jgi:carboxymethylenebutenolidase